MLKRGKNEALNEEEDDDVAMICLPSPDENSGKNISQKVIEKYAASLIMTNDDDHFDLTEDYDISPFELDNNERRDFTVEKSKSEMANDLDELQDVAFAPSPQLYAQNRP